MKKIERRIIIIFVVGILSCTNVQSKKKEMKQEEKIFLEAIRFDKLDLVKELVKVGVDINQIESDDPLNKKIYPIHYAIKNRSMKVLHYLIEKGANINVTDLTGNTVLMLAVDINDISTVELLLKKGAEVNKKTILGDTAIDFAARASLDINGENPMTEILLLNGAKVTQNTVKMALKNEIQYIPVKMIVKKALEVGCKTGLSKEFEAVILNNKKEINRIIKDKGKINEIEKISGKTMLHFASAFGYYETTKWLINKGANVDSISRNNNTPLIVAARYNNVKIVKYLIERGADIDRTGLDKMSAIENAVKENNNDIVRYIIEKKGRMNYEKYKPKLLTIAAYKGNVEIMDYLVTKGHTIEGEDAIDAIFGAAENDKIESVKYMLERGVSPNVQNERILNSSLLQSVCANGSKDIIKLLVEKGADVNREDKTGGTPLKEAVRKNRKEIVQYLINNGADIVNRSIRNGRETSEYAATTIAAGKGYLDVLIILVEEEKKIKKQRNLLSEAMIAAAANGHREIVEYLIKKGANINYQNRLGRTALMYASSNKKEEVINILKKNGAEIKIKDKDGRIAEDYEKKSMGRYKKE